MHCWKTCKIFEHMPNKTDGSRACYIGPNSSLECCIIKRLEGVIWTNSPWEIRRILIVAIGAVGGKSKGLLASFGLGTSFIPHLLIFAFAVNFGSLRNLFKFLEGLNNLVNTYFVHQSKVWKEEVREREREWERECNEPSRKWGRKCVARKGKKQIQKEREKTESLRKRKTCI